MEHRKFKNLVKLGPSDMADVIDRLIDTNLKNRKYTSVSLAVTGVAGIGKTSIVEQVAKRKGVPFHKISLTNMQEVNDLIGFPMKTYQIRRGSEEAWVPEELLELKSREGFVPSGEIDMSYAIPEWLPKDMDIPIVLALDDYSRAMPHILQATMEIIDRQEYISWKLPKGSTIILTTNPSDDNDYMGVNELGKAQMTRFIELGLKFDKEDWAIWAGSNGVDERCIDFILTYPELIDTDSNSIPPRMFDKFFRLIQDIKNWNTSGKDRDFVRSMGAGSIGPEASQVFETFIKKGLDKILSSKEIFSLPEDKVEESLKEALFSKTEEGVFVKQDVCNRLITRILSHLLYQFSKKPITPAYVKRLEFLEQLKFTGTDTKFLGEDSWTYLLDSLMSKGGNNFRALARDTELLKKVL